MEESNKLETLLEKSGYYHPLYGGGLAMHLPMVLVALERIHAPNTKLIDTFNESIIGLERIGGLDKVTAVNSIEEQLGHSESFRAYLKYYKHELATLGTQAVLKKSLPILIPGVAASAFHALIRLAYALEANCQSEVAVALAYWSAEYQSFELNEETTAESLESILTRLSALGEEFEFSPGIIVNRMSEIGDLLKDKACVVLPNSMDISDLRELALKSFYLSDDFTLLHTVTGCHAFSIVMPYLENKEAALKELWKAILVAYLSTGLSFKNIEIQTVEGDVDFSPIIQGARTSDDSHVIKLVYTCLSEYKKWGNKLYFEIAQRAVMNDDG